MLWRRHHSAGQCHPRLQGPGRRRSMHLGAVSSTRQLYFNADGILMGERVMPAIEGLDLVGHCGIPRPVLQEILVDEATALGANIRLGVACRVAARHRTQRGRCLHRWQQRPATTSSSAPMAPIPISAAGVRRRLHAALLRPGLLALQHGEAAGHGLQRHILRPQQGRVDPADTELHVHVPDDRGTGQPPDAGGSPA